MFVILKGVYLKRDCYGNNSTGIQMNERNSKQDCHFLTSYKPDQKLYSSLHFINLSCFKRIRSWEHPLKVYFFFTIRAGLFFTYDTPASYTELVESETAKLRKNFVEIEFHLESKNQIKIQSIFIKRPKFKFL